MKRMTKKLGAIVLVLAMCMSLCCTALVSAAEGDYTITVTNTTQGYTYAAYKIFDATVGENGNVAYYITEDNAWFDIITEGYEADDAGVYTTECFVLTPTNTAAGYTVQVKDGVSDAAIIAYFNGQITMSGPDADGQYTLTAPEGVTASATGSGNGGSLVLDVSDDGAGYYFVTSTLGATVTITTTDPQASVIDKNTPPRLDSKEITSGLEVDESEHSDSSAIGDTVSFEVTANVPLYAPGDSDSLEGYMVTDYEFDDEMTIGLEIRGLTQGTDYTVDSDGRYWATTDLINSWVTLKEGDTTYVLTDVAYNVTLELIYPSTDENGNIQFDGFILKYNTVSDEVLENLDDNDEGQHYQKASEIETTYPVNATIIIDYSAELTGDVDYDNVNHIDMFWHVTPFDTPKTPSYGGHDEDEDNVYVLELDLTKIDGETSEALAGAEFQLTGTNLKKVVTQTTYTYTELNADEYAAAKAAGTELWFEVTSGSSISIVESDGKYYTNVDPYDLMAMDPDDPDLANYVVDEQTYADPDYPYIANTLTVTHSSGLQDVEDGIITGITDENGKLQFIGLTVGDWTLTEITAPDGYNLLPEELTFTISVSSWTTAADGSIQPVFSIDATGTANGYTYSDGVVYITVENNAGTELPGTGGIGTTIFYIIGGVLVVGAVVVLVTRRRMTREN